MPFFICFLQSLYNVRMQNIPAHLSWPRMERARSEKTKGGEGGSSEETESKDHASKSQKMHVLTTQHSACMYSHPSFSANLLLLCQARDLKAVTTFLFYKRARVSQLGILLLTNLAAVLSNLNISSNLSNIYNIALILRGRIPCQRHLLLTLIPIKQGQTTEVNK